MASWSHCQVPLRGRGYADPPSGPNLDDMEMRSHQLGVPRRGIPGDLSAPCWQAERHRAAAARLGHNSSIGEQLQIGAGAAAARVGQSSTVGEQSCAWRVSRGSPRLSTRFIVLSKHMDRSWIFGAPFTPAYVKGVEEFMQFVSERYPKDSQILCPCSRCLNQKMQSQHDASDHIHIYGMSATYTRWIHHGESADTEVVENLEQQVEGRDHDFGIHVDVADDDYDEDHGVPEMIGELYAAAEAEGQQPMFARVLEDAKKSLSPGSRHSKFSFLVRMLYIKSRYRIGNTTFSAMIKLLSEGYPQSELPKSYDEAKKYLRELGLGCENIHVCPNNCVLFRKRYAKDNVCPVCKASRWQDEIRTKRVPHKVLRHFPLLPRLKRIFASKRTSEETQWHQKKRTPVNNVMSHPADGEAWKDFDRREKTFASDPRNLRLALATDGFNPFGNMSTQYSPKSPGKDFDVFLEPLIEDLIDLWKGVRTFDACTGKKFDLRAGHAWRRSLAFDGKRENKDEPGKFTLEEVLEELEKVKDVRPGKHPDITGNKRKRNEGPRIYSRKVGLWRLPYWQHLKLPHNLDMMHIEKNICENILGTLLNVQGKTKDTTNARLDLYDMGIRPEFHLQQHGNSVIAPPAPYVLGKDQKIAFCKFLKGIKFPDGYAANLARYITADGSKIQGKLKTHSCHILLQRIIPAGLRGLVRKDVYEAVAEIGTFFRELCSRNLWIDVVKRLKQEIPLILCKLEKIFPPAFFDVMVHLAIPTPSSPLGHSSSFPPHPPTPPPPTHFANP
ncbi:uncharacterized protein [Miscanthus floridulus]|uniref:uncharacterized protein n=1 Tax=Miscanthus floridulus TaxID=154761 RepID=UPI003458CFFC